MGILQQVSFDCEVITPMFLGGANPREPELRPASVRGALRFWLRAALGGVVGDDNLDTLRQLEADVFGETEHGSTIITRVDGSLTKMLNFDLDRDKDNKPIRSGHNYFYYSTRLGDNRIPFDIVNSNFTFTLSARPGAQNGKDALKKAVAAVWLLTHLGGLGTRARRCGGSLQVVSGSLSGLPNFVVSAEAAVALEVHLALGLKQIVGIMGSLQPPQANFDVLHPDICRVWVIADNNGWKNWKEAVEAIGSAMKTYRAKQQDRNRTNAIFGLPINHAPNDIKQLGKRRSSPLWIRITKLANGVYVGVATLFKTDFINGSATIGGGYTLIERFMASFPVCLEVNYR